MVIIISTVGATRMYQDKQMFHRTFSAFLNSLRQQTDQDFRLILVGHDRPEGLCIEEPNVTFMSVSGDVKHETTETLVIMPTDMATSPSWIIEPYDRAIDDMSRKTKASCYLAGLWAYHYGLKDFWLLRMDSDDLLANDVVANLNATDPDKTRAVWSRRSHMFDPRSGEMAEHSYPGSLTCNSIHLKFNGPEIPQLYYHFNDHTTFWQMVKRDGISNEERDFQLCITTNSQNSISGRPELDKEKGITRVPLTPELVHRYGISAYLPMKALQ